jgi:hypothetical protein
MKNENSHWGTTLDAFLTKEGIREAAKAEALRRIVAWQLEKEMERQGTTKAQLAERMHTSLTARGRRANRTMLRVSSKTWKHPPAAIASQSST